MRIDKLAEPMTSDELEQLRSFLWHPTTRTEPGGWIETAARLLATIDKLLMRSQLDLQEIDRLQLLALDQKIDHYHK